MKKTLDDTLSELSSNKELDISEFRINSKGRNPRSIPIELTTSFADGEEDGYLTVKAFGGRRTWVLSMGYLLSKTIERLHKHKWSIVKPAIGYNWPTSDNPVAKINYCSERDYDLKGGWDVKNGNIFFPISPNHAMFVQIGQRPLIKGTRLDESLTRKLISIVVHNSYRMIISRNIDEVIPCVKKRSVDPDRVIQERQEWVDWHSLNSDIERNYL